MKINKIVVGCLTYGSLPRCEGFIKSTWQNLDPGFNVTLVCCDDGTPDLQALKERRKFCEKSNCILIEHGNNRGISAGWNTLASHDPNADLVVIFNDDIRFTTPGWLTRLVYFFEHNEQVGTVGLPLIHEEGYKDSESRWWNPPGVVGCAVGCAFAIQPKVLFSVENSEDNSRGFAEFLISFHEELVLGFRLAEKGILSWMLAFPPFSHQGGATFATNPELVWRHPHSYLSMEEFLAYVRSSRWYVPQYEDKYKEGIVDRMSYSRGAFCKMFGLLELNRKQIINGEEIDVWDEPQRLVHERVVKIWPARVTRWLDRDGKEQEVLIAP